MTPASASFPHRRLLAVITPGDGSHLLAPTVAAYRSRLATSRVSLDDELAMCLARIDDDPHAYERAAAGWHARWSVEEPTTLTLAETHTAMTLLRALAGPRGAEAARTLRYLLLVHGQTGTAEVLRRWLERHE